MLTGVIVCFIIGYVAIVFEHPLKIDKTVPALLMGALCWAFVSLGHLPVVDAHHHIGEMDSVLLHHIGKVAEILFFLIGAMTIVELIDLHKGFSVITNRISTTKKTTMLWIVCILAFFLSATLDNLASTIVLVSLLRRLVPDKTERLWFVSLAVIAANAGGAWSPIGDVTTTMLWIGKKVTTGGLITHLVLPSIVCLIVPVMLASRLKVFQGHITAGEYDAEKGRQSELVLGSKRILGFGLGGLIFVPIFKTITHLPPYVGMMLALGCIQSRSCNSDHCPTGIATQNPDRYQALDVTDKSERVMSFHMANIKHFIELLEAAGVHTLKGITPDLLMRRIDNQTVKSFAELYPQLEPASLLNDDTIPADWAREIALASADKW